MMFRTLVAMVMPVLLASAASAASVDLGADRSRGSSGDPVVITSVVRAGTAPINAATWKLVVPTQIQVTGVKGPQKVTVGPARLDYQDAAGTWYYVLSNTLTLRISSANLPNRPDAAGNLAVEVGDMLAQETETLQVLGTFR